MNREILITGAANGIGRAAALKFANSGWHVWATDKDGQGLENLGNIPGLNMLVMDVTSDDSVKNGFARVSSMQLPIDLVIHCAGIDNYFPFSEAPVADFTEIFNVNLFGAYRVNQVFLPVIRKPGGMIIQVGSESLNLEIPFMAYSITKKAVESYSKVLRQELKPIGIRVVVVRPGAVQTGFLENVRKMKYPVKEPVLAKAFEEFARSAPREIGKTITPEAVAELFLRIAGSRTPCPVYKINNSLKLRVASKLPFSWKEWIVQRRIFH